MKRLKIVIPIFLGFALLFTACGGGAEKSADVAQSTETQTVESQVTKELTPGEMGNQIGEIYVKAMQEVTELLKDKPESSAVKSQVEEMKEMYIKKLVEFGRLRERLSESERAQVDSRLSSVMISAGNQPWFSGFNEIQQYYFSDREFHKLVISFNIITQYANFDLLKKQEPEEARRLGIE